MKLGEKSDHDVVMLICQSPNPEFQNYNVCFRVKVPLVKIRGQKEVK